MEVNHWTNELALILTPREQESCADKAARSTTPRSLEILNLFIQHWAPIVQQWGGKSRIVFTTNLNNPIAKYAHKFFTPIIRHAAN